MADYVFSCLKNIKSLTSKNSGTLIVILGLVTELFESCIQIPAFFKSQIWIPIWTTTLLLSPFWTMVSPRRSRKWYPDPKKNRIHMASIPPVAIIGSEL
jgi:hypothetical protein